MNPVSVVLADHVSAGEQAQGREIWEAGPSGYGRHEHFGGQGVPTSSGICSFRFTMSFTQAPDFRYTP